MTRFEQTQSVRFLKSEKVRPRLSQECESVASGVALDFGLSTENPIFQLTPLSWIPEPEKMGAVRITADRARKSWTELRAGVRYFNLSFVITIDGRELVFLRRHPRYTLKRLPHWLAESERRSSGVSVRQPQPGAIAATMSNGTVRQQAALTPEDTQKEVSRPELIASVIVTLAARVGAIEAQLAGQKPLRRRRRSKSSTPATSSVESK